MREKHDIGWWVGHIIIWIIALAPLVLVALGNLIAVTELRYPAMNWEQVPLRLLYTLLGVLPTLVIVVPWLVEKLRCWPLQKGWRIASGIVYALLLPFTFMATRGSCSRRRYRRDGCGLLLLA